ncbi:MAG: phage major capsid protein [Actinomycetota bacterium]
MASDKQEKRLMSSQTEPTAPPSLGEQFVESEQYQKLRAKGFAGKFTSGNVELRTLLDSGGSSGGDAVIPERLPGIRPLSLRRLQLADLLLPGSTSSNAVLYVEEQSFTNAAATVAEAAEKPESAMVFNQVNEPVRKVATWLPVTDEMLEDVEALRSFIDVRLTTGVQLEEEDQLLNGDGTPPNISGILDRSGLQTTITVGALNAADSVYQMVTTIRDAFYQPNGMVIHPIDWGSSDFRLAKDGNEQYFAGGPFTGQYGVGGIIGETFWGLNVVVTPAIAQGSVLVGDFSQAQIFRRSGITVEASNSHSDYFTHDKTAIRAEERFALAVYAPGAFGLVDTTP